MKNDFTPADSQNKAMSVAKALLDHGAFKISLDPLFTWTSGIKSPVYCDLRALISDISVRAIIVDGFVDMIKNSGKEFDVIAGTATAGIPWAAWVAERMYLPMVYIRGEAKEHGTKKRIEGVLMQGSNVALIEDHISTGKSSVSATIALREEGGATVDMIFAINTYELKKAEEAFAEAKLNIQTVTSYSRILESAQLTGFIDDAKRALLSDFSIDPSGWAGRNGIQ